MNLFKLISTSSILLGISYAIRFALTFVLARFLSADELGVYSWSVAAFGILGIITNFGLDLFLIRKIPEYRNTLIGMTGSVIRHVQKQSVINFLILISIILPISYFSTYFFKGASLYNLELMVIIFAMPFAAFSLIFSTSLRALNHPISGQFIESIFQTAILLILILVGFNLFDHLIPNNQRTLFLVSFFLFSWILNCFFSYRIFIKKIKIPKLLLPSSEDVKKWRKEQSSIVFGIFGWSFLGRSDIFLLAFLVSSSEVGAYFICIRLAETLLFFGTVAYYVWGGEISNLIQEDKLAQAQAIVKKSSQLCISTTFIIGLIAFIYAEKILSFVNKRYIEDAYLFKLALFVFFIKGASGFMKPLFYILGEQYFLAKWQWIIGITFTALVFITVPIYGVVGCVISFGFCEIIFLMIMVPRLHKKHNISLSPI